MQTDKDAVVLGEVTKVPLWAFELELQDRRTGDYLSGQTVETGNEDYDLTAAEDAIKRRYGQLGYEVTDCTFKAERIYTFSALKAYEQADESDSAREPQRIEDEDSDSWQDEIAATLAELDE